MNRNLNLILLNAGYAVHHADWNWKGVHSPFARIYLVNSGSAKVVMPDKTHLLMPGHLYLIPSFITHSYVCDGDFTLYYFHIYDEQNIFDRLSFPFEVPAGDLEKMLIKKLLEINQGRELKVYDPNTYDNPPTFFRSISDNELFPFYTIIETKGILLQLFSKFLMQASFKQQITDKRITKTISYIRDNIEQIISVQELAQACCLTEEYFIRIFKKEMKCTPVQYINRKKIERAQILLSLEKKSVQEIAYNLSFWNISYFHRLFKKHTGMTPHQYRKESSV